MRLNHEVRFRFESSPSRSSHFRRRARCAARTSSDLQQHPGRYEDRTVTVNGVVTDSWGIPLLPYKFYRVDDGTGADRGAVAKPRECRARVSACASKGRVGNVAVFGGRSLGLHLREEDLDVRR